MRAGLSIAIKFILCTQALLGRPDFKFVFDGLHGVAGPYAKRIFVQVQNSHSVL